jgi:branched-subunit amino acid ABC-type transport system permease component
MDRLSPLRARIAHGSQVAIGAALALTFVGFCWALRSDLPTSPPIIAVAALLMGCVWVTRRFVRGA